MNKLGWYLKRVAKSFENAFSLLLRPFVSVKKGRVACWAYSFKQYSCNPRYLTEYLLENNPEFEIYWVFRRKVDISGIDKRVKCVRFRSLQYYILINTAEFLFTNARTEPYGIFWHKRQGQKYAMLWHGGVCLKKIEKDAEDKLGFAYLKRAKADSKVCDLMISGSEFQTRLLKEKFWYDGEVMECGIPRNDIFFDESQNERIKKGLCEKYGIPQDSRIVLYAPTFRSNKSIEPYRIDWNALLPSFRKVYGSDKVSILVRLHPNLISRVDVGPLLNSPLVSDATRYHDMQELLSISDMLITDYSSVMFDFSMLGRPCLIYATDIEAYDRGFYFRFDELPFPLARNQEELKNLVESFNIDTYMTKTKRFFNERIKPYDQGNASASIAGWMKEHSI